MVGSYLMSLDDKGITLRYLKVVKIRGKGYGGGGGGGGDCAHSEGHIYTDYRKR